MTDTQRPERCFRARCSPSRPRHGLSLVEVIMSTMLLGLVLIGAMNMIGGALETRHANEQALEGPALAMSLMSEILAMPYDDPDSAAEWGIETDEVSVPGNRLGFDDVDDYNNWSESPPQQRDGTALPGYAAWRRAVEIKKVRWDETTVELSDGANDEGLKRVTVTITDPQGRPATLQALRSRSGALEQAPGADMTVITEMEVDLEIGGTRPVPGAAHLPNHAEDR